MSSLEQYYQNYLLSSFEKIKPLLRDYENVIKLGNKGYIK
jgi:hypothetical protein